MKQKLQEALNFPLPNWETAVFYALLTMVSLWVCHEIFPGLWVIAIPGAFTFYTLISISSDPGAGIARRNGWWYLGYGTSLTCVALLASCIYGPIDKANLNAFAYRFDEGAGAPLTIWFNDDQDTLIWSTGGLIWLPQRKEIHYAYTAGGKEISGTIPPLPKGEWYMSIGHLGIAVYKEYAEGLYDH